MTDQNEQLPDIEAGLNEMAKETTAAELMKQKGQRYKLKVMKERDLKDFINRALSQLMSGRSEHLDEAERQQILEEAEAKVRAMAEKAAKAEAERQQADERRAKEEAYASDLKQRIDTLAQQAQAQEAGAAEELQRTIEELTNQNRALMAERQSLQEEVTAAQADVMVIEEDLSNTRNILQTTISERDKANTINRDLMLRSTDLVQGVLGLDNDYYGERHQRDNPANEEADAHEAFFHDFVVGSEVIATLSTDLERLRAITQKQAEETEQAQAAPQLLTEDLELLEQIKAGSLAAVDVAEPVEGLIEALAGTREEAVQLQRTVDETSNETVAKVALTAVPDAEGEPAQVLAGATQVVRELGAALAAERARIDRLEASTAGADKLNATIRQHMLRSTDLVQGVLGLDSAYYNGRHQAENPADEEADAQEAFFHDFEVGAKVVETLASDLTRLAEYVQQEQDQEQVEEHADKNLMEQNLALLEQIKAGSLAAVDLAEPAAGLAEALNGARQEVVELQRALDASDVGGDHIGVSAAPDADGDPQEVVAGAAQVVREMGAALAKERAKVVELSGKVGDQDRAKETLRASMLQSSELVQQALQLDDQIYDGRHQAENPADESGDAQQQFFHDFAVGAQVLADLARDLETLATVEQPASAASGDESQAIRALPIARAVERVATLARQVDDLAEQAAGAQTANEEVESIHAAFDQALAAIAAKAEAEGLTVAEPVRDADAPAEQRVAAATQALDQLKGAGLSPEVAGELNEALVVLVGDEDEEAPVEDQGETLTRLKERITRLGTTYQQAQQQLQASHEREAALAGQIKELAQRLHVLLAADDSDDDASVPDRTVVAEAADDEDEIEVSIKTLEQRLAEDQDEPDHDQMGQALDGLITSLNRRADTRQQQMERQAQQQHERLQGLVQDLVRAARDDDKLAEDPATRELAEVMEQVAESDDTRAEAGDRAPTRRTGAAKMPDPNRLLAYSRRVITAMAARKDDLQSEAIRLRDDLTELRRRNEELETKATRLRTNIDELRSRNDDLAGQVAAVGTRADELQELRDRSQQAEEAARRHEKEVEELSEQLTLSKDQVHSSRQEIGALGRELVGVARLDAQLAEHEAVIDLATAIDTQADDEEQGVDDQTLIEQCRQVLDAMGERRRALLDELSGVREQLAASMVEAEGQAAKISEQERALARIGELERQVADLTTEKDEAMEIVLSGKEVIALLKDKEDKLTSERNQLAKELAAVKAKLRSDRVRKSKAEAATHGLAEALSENVQRVLAQAIELDGVPDLESARVDLEVALSELPDDETVDDVPVREDLSDDLHTAGSVVVEALVARAEALGARLQENERELEQLRREQDGQREELANKAAEEADRTARVARAEARLQAAKDENRHLGEQLASANAELSKTREEQAATQVDLDDLRQQIASKDGRIVELERRSAEADDLQVKVDRLERRLREGVESERGLGEAIAALAEETSQTSSEFGLQVKKETARFSRAFKKLEAAMAGDQEQAPDGLVATSHLLLEQVANQATMIGDEARRMRDEQNRLKHEGEELRSKASHFESLIADREHRLGNMETELSELRDRQAASEATVAELTGERDELKSLLLNARAALEEYKAREAERASGSGAAVGELRQELDAERVAREEAERAVGEVREELEGRIAGLRRRSEDLSARIEERDQRIIELQAQLDGAGKGRLELADLQDRVEQLQLDLGKERERAADLEHQLEERSAGGSRIAGLEQELTQVQQRRDELYGRIRDMEAELAEERGQIEGLRNAKETLRRELAEQSERLRGELSKERARLNSEEEKNRELREKVAGLQARVRTFTGDQG